MAKFGAKHEGQLAPNEEIAYRAASLHNYRVEMQKKEAREAAKKAKIMAKITLPKLKFLET